MYSQCPECLTRFRVTAAALRAAHGTVRCGRCGSAFDALQHLTDTVPEEPEVRTVAPLEAPIAPTSTAQPARPGDGDGDGDDAEFHFSADDIEKVFVDARDWTQQFPVDDEGHPEPGIRQQAASVSAGSVVFVHEPEAIEDITLEGERIVIEGLPELDEDLREIVRAAEPVDDETNELEPEAAEPLPVDPDPTGRYRTLAAAPEAVARERGPEPVAPAPVVPFRLRQREAFDEPLVAGPGDDTVEARRGSRAMWALGAVLLAGVLLVQLAHHYRHELARDSRVGPVLRDVYARLGRPLAPHWDLGAFELRQWGPDSSAFANAGAMSVRAGLRNAAPFAQPLPLLRLDLEDRFGNAVARRDFEPREYLKDPAQAGRLLAAGATTEAALDVVDTGRDAVGYRLDLCMRTDAGTLQCAQSPAPDAQARR